MRKRRYEILLPLKFNAGRPVAPSVIQLTWNELVAQFSGLTLLPHEARGIWKDEGIQYEDELFRLLVDVEDDEATQQFFKDFKAVLLQRFEQLEIYIASYPIDRR